MSLITVFGTKDFLSFTSDGRLNANSESVREDYKKILRLSDDIVIGATGSHNQAKSLFEISPYWLKESKNDIEIFANTIRSIVLSDIPKNKFPRIDLHIVVGGINLNNEIAVYVFTNDPDFLLQTQILLEDTKYYLALGKSSALDKLENLIEGEKGISIERIKEIQRIVNSQIAATDNTVNEVTFNEIITKLIWKHKCLTT
ncbi:hypothetical protein [Bacillus toyonensis]|uniref:hypothetical protein n=1 Tax=Bacillus toyonensis TaxID=155322 RepID=UPI0023780736|nr:hypothetical protein [Bacillus toyonensis]MDD9265043.1 hypothetical protein [Bacillus toyonensis]